MMLLMIIASVGIESEDNGEWVKEIQAGPVYIRTGNNTVYIYDAIHTLSLELDLTVVKDDFRNLEWIIQEGMETLEKKLEARRINTGRIKRIRTNCYNPRKQSCN